MRVDAKPDRDRRGHIDKGAAVVYVLSLSDDVTEIVGFYTLASTSIPVTAVETAKHFPRYPNLPAILLGRLAVDSRYKGQGLGALMLLDALGRAEQASSSIAAAAVIVDAKDDAAASFYRKYGFIPCLDSPQRFYLPMRTIAMLNLSPPPLSLFPRRK